MFADLSQRPIADALRTLASQRKSGDLQARAGKIAKTVFFDHGRIVFAASNLRKDRLGETLVALGRITDEEFSRASALLADGARRRKFGEALVDSGLMDKNEVGRSVARQVNRIVISLFAFSEGVASFEERRCAIPLEYMVSLSVHRLLYEGIRHMKSHELVLAGLGDMDRRVRTAETPPFDFEADEVTDVERDVLEQARRRVTLRRLAWVPGGLDFDRSRAVYALLSGGLLEDPDVPPDLQPARPVVQMETGTFLLSALRKQKEPSRRESIRAELDRELEHSARLDRETWLRVSRTAPREELVKALEDKMERYHAILEQLGEGDEDLKNDLEVILGRASAMLRLARQAPAPPPPTSGPERTAEVPAIILDADTAPAPPPAPPRAINTTPEMEMQRARIEQLLMEGEIRLTVADFVGAIKVYSELVRLVPDAAGYHARLALSLAGHPPTAKEAERSFLDAVRLDPDNADLHYYFGRYYKKMRQRSRAVAELQTALRLNPRHQKAKEELEATAPKESALLNLRKLFR